MHHSLFRFLICMVVAEMLLAIPAVTYAQPYQERQPDSLLFRPELQRVVDLQVERDGTALSRLLRDSNPAVRARAAFALASVQDPAAESALIDLLRDNSVHVRTDAAFALGQLALSSSSPAVLDALLAEQDPTVRAELISALGKSGDQASLRRLVDMSLNEADLPHAALAAGRYAIRDIHAPEAAEWLVPLLRSSDPYVRQNAAYYFGRSRQVDAWMPWVDSVRSALDRMSPLDPAAMHLLSGLGRLSLQEDIPRVSRWLGQAQDWRTRVSAARALGVLAHNDAVHASLLSALSDSVHHVAIVSAEALLGAPSWSSATLAQVRNWLESHPEAHPAATTMLQGYARHSQDASFVQKRIRRMRDTDSPRYPDALTALSELPGEASFEWLREEATDSSSHIAYAALEALGARWQRDRSVSEAAAYVAAFSNALRSGDLALMYTAAPLLADSLFAPLGSVDVLTDVYNQLQTPEDIEPMTAILGALGEIDAPPGRPTLEAALQHPNPVIRRAAADALQLEAQPGDQAAEPPERTVDWTYLYERGLHPLIILETEKGTIEMELHVEQAPLTVQTLLQLTEQGRFDGVPFHRVVPNFVVQGGDFERRDGFGGPGFTIRSEFTRIPFLRGAIGMASAGKDTEGSQFFVTHSMQPHLDGRYTAFGIVTRGMEVVDRLAKGDRIIRASVTPDPQID